MSEDRLDYAASGVDSTAEEIALKRLGQRVRRTFGFAGARGQPGAVHLDLGYFANVIEIAPRLGLAVSIDGVGTKLLLAQLLGKYDTVGIDCIAMNVNDVLCVGARPLAVLDYIAVEHPDPDVLDAIAAGLERGAEEAGVSIPGGELAQVAELIRGVRPGAGFDLVGAALGLVSLDRVILGDGLDDDDVVIGLPSSGIHSNGLSLARRALFDAGGFGPGDRPDALGGRSVGEELLEPTRLYVKPVLSMLGAAPEVKGLAHITGDGLLNLLRMKSEVGFELDDLPEPPPIFGLIREAGDVDDSEMYRVFNMGVGFCVALPGAAAGRAIEALGEAGMEGARVIGRVRSDAPGEIRLPGLIGTADAGFE